MAIRKREEDYAGEILAMLGEEGKIYIDVESILDSAIDLANQDENFRDKLGNFIKDIIK